MSDCPVCEKHHGEGFLVGEVLYEDERLFVNHAPEHIVKGYLGYLFVDARRHVRGLAELEDEEACAIARMVSRLARALPNTCLLAKWKYTALRKNNPPKKTLIHEYTLAENMNTGITHSKATSKSGTSLSFMS